MQISPALLGVLLLLGCAGVPTEQAAGTPAGRVATESLVSLQANGASVGAAVALHCAACGGDVLVTNAHVLRQAGDELSVRRGDGGEAVPAQVIAVSPRMDLAVLSAPPGFAMPASLAPAMPGRGATVWALGPQGLGRALARGQVARASLRMRSFGSGFTARMGALMGFSGGPVVDRAGQLVGLTTALTSPGMAPVMAALTGVDLDGILHGDGREVFVLSIHAIEEEVNRIAPR
jgi:S1-C subfamily serine protease